MAALQTFDQALRDSAGADGDAWSDDGVVCVGGLAAALSDDDLALLGRIWTDRPPRWQKHCAEVLGQARHLQAIEVLLDFVHRGKAEVTLAALETLSEFDPTLLSPGQVDQIQSAIHTLLAKPVAPLHQILLENLLSRLRSAGAAAE